MHIQLFVINKDCEKSENQIMAKITWSMCSLSSLPQRLGGQFYNYVEKICKCASQKSDKHLQVDYNSVNRKLGLPFKRAQLIPGSHLYVELLQVPQWRTYSINHLTDVDALFIIHFKVTHTLVTNSLLQWSQSHSP